MSEDYKVQVNNQTPQQAQDSKRVIDESNYQVFAPRQNGPSAVGRGGDPLFRRIRASKEQLTELLEETTTVQDWIQRETCNKVALTCLENENLKDIYYEIKDGFGDYGPILLMGFKTPQGVEIPRLKLLDKNEVLTGDYAIKELNKRAEAYKCFKTEKYESVALADEQEEDDIVVTEIQDYVAGDNDIG